MNAGGDVRVATLRVRGAAIDSPRLRLSASGLVAGATLRPAGLPPAAVLIVRGMADPLTPGADSPSPAEPAGRLPASTDRWRQAARHVVEDRLRQAARPADGTVPPGASAVLFADEAELVAVLAHDLAIGRARERWWWTVVLRDLSSSRPLAGLLWQRGQILPAVLGQLATWGRAALVLATLEAREVAAVEAAMWRAWGLPPTTDAAPSGRAVPDRVESAPGGDVPGTETSAAAQASEPWSRWVPPAAVPETLEPATRALLGVGLLLHRAPAAARTAGFVDALASWRAGIRAGAAPRSGDPVTRSRHPARDARGTGTDEATDARGRRLTAGSDASVTAAGDRTVTPRGDHRGTPADRLPPPAGARGPRPPAAGRPEAPARAHPTPRESSESAVTPDAVPEHRRGGRRPTVSGRPQPGGPAATPAAPEADIGPDRGAPQDLPTGASSPTVRTPEGGALTTELGGVLFLVNVIRRLELPDVCEPGWRLASDVGGWGIVELLGRILVGSDPPDAYADPIWAVLAELAGRPPGTLPGPARPGPDVFVLPPIWTRDVPDGNDQRWAWAGRRGLVRVWSDRGYVVGEEIGGGAASRGRARRLLSLHAGRGAHDLTRSALRAAPVVPTDVPLLAGLDAHLARWLGIVTPFVRWRLTRAFRPAGAPAGDLDAPLLRRRAQLHVTATHVDMVLGLDDATVPVRVAGLDLDPGWVPELGRVVRFLYE